MEKGPNSLINIGLSILKARLFKKSAPVFVNWSITNKCDSRCRYCKLWNIKSEELTTKQIIDLIDELENLGTKVINFTGGEPLMHNDIGVIIDYTHKKGIFSILNLSGSLVSERKTVLNNVSTVKLSFDGPKDVHDFIRGENSFEKVIEAIHVIKSRPIRLFLCSVLSRYNLRCVDYILDTAQKFNVPVAFQPASLTILGSDEINPISPPLEEYRKAISKLISKKKDRVLGKYIFNSITGLKHIYNWPLPKKIPCGGGLIFCRIESNGDISLCARSQISRKLNCIDMGFREAFNELRPRFCDSCWCAGVIECNHLLSFDFDTIINCMRMKT